MRSAWLTAAAQLAALWEAALVEPRVWDGDGHCGHRQLVAPGPRLRPRRPRGRAPGRTASIRAPTSQLREIPPRHPPPACFVQREQAALNSRFGQVEQPGQFGVGDPASGGGAGVRVPGVIPNGMYEPRRRCPGRRNIRVAGRRVSPGEVVHDELVAVGASKEVEVGGCSAAA
jgi:hypothetical protein